MPSQVLGNRKKFFAIKDLKGQSRLSGGARFASKNKVERSLQLGDGITGSVDFVKSADYWHDIGL